MLYCASYPKLPILPRSSLSVAFDNMCYSRFCCFEWKRLRDDTNIIKRIEIETTTELYHICILRISLLKRNSTHIMSITVTSSVVVFPIIKLASSGKLFFLIQLDLSLLIHFFLLCLQCGHFRILGFIKQGSCISRFFS